MMDDLEVNGSLPKYFDPLITVLKSEGNVDLESKAIQISTIINSIMNIKIQKLREDIENRLTEMNNPVSYRQRRGNISFDEEQELVAKFETECIQEQENSILNYDSVTNGYQRQQSVYSGGHR